MTPEIPYKRKAVDPVECIKAGWELIKRQYWLFVGMTFVAFFIGSAVPLGILMGPMMCGIYLTCFAQRRREPVDFGLLFKGMGGLLFCYVGMFLILPISYGAIASAYEQVFGLAHAREVSNMPPPPPIFE